VGTTRPPDLGGGCLPAPTRFAPPPAGNSASATGSGSTRTEATGDQQWIHVDPERAATGLFGGTIAHGYLTLSLIPVLASQVYALQAPGPTLNYGANRVRFPAPVRVGSRIRDRVSLVEATAVKAGLQLVVGHVLEIEDSQKPCCVAETVVLLLDQV
jgi:acyl dehydratase